ncbi:condensin-2 complex subunit H2 [Cocos nucifera]|uniref:Condensin-2 complex subunit H2 n=1 Tax=Cocos nucifera TaxID=13894 RepID=A0A8K0IV94_COCNU|nr:condensin-2 complex subunit H2 [Cocos nucifera]
MHKQAIPPISLVSFAWQDQQEKASIQPDGSESGAVLNEENEIFLGLDDVLVEANICLDGGFDKGDTSKYFLRPPANLLVLERDCLDTCCEASELESYLLAACDFYGDFLLLDPCDAGAVYDSLKTNAAGKENIAPHRGRLIRSKSSHSVLTSPTGSSGATSYGYSNVMDDSNDDPWKPGNLIIKPFREVKGFRKQVIRNVRRNTSTSEFPVAKLDDIISKEFLRRSLTRGKQETYNGFSGFEDENDDNGGDNHPPDFDQAEHDLLNSMCNMDTKVQFCHGKQSDNAMTFDHVEGRPRDDMDSHATLEDLCHSHLDTRPPFDIHLYGKRILDKLSFKMDGGGCMSFADVVMGQPKNDVAGTFSALLQLVDNENVDLQRAPASDEFVCHTAANPFYVKLLRHARSEKMENYLKRKRASFPLRKGCIIANSSTSEATSPLKPLHQNGGFFPKLGKGTDIKCTLEGKRRWRFA